MNNNKNKSFIQRFSFLIYVPIVTLTICATIWIMPHPVMFCFSSIMFLSLIGLAWCNFAMLHLEKEMECLKNELDKTPEQTNDQK
jgi:hypothetical protein